MPKASLWGKSREKDVSQRLTSLWLASTLQIPPSARLFVGSPAFVFSNDLLFTVQKTDYEGKVFRVISIYSI
ncbi:hypothetical protein [Marivirga lumbricoides]